jgi:hypothetical protein
MVARNIMTVRILNSKTFRAGAILIMKSPSTTFNEGLHFNQFPGESSLACHFTRIFLVQAETPKQDLKTLVF